MRCRCAGGVVASCYCVSGVLEVLVGLNFERLGAVVVILGVRSHLWLITPAGGVVAVCLRCAGLTCYPKCAVCWWCAGGVLEVCWDALLGLNVETFGAVFVI